MWEPSNPYVRPEWPHVLRQAAIKDTLRYHWSGDGGDVILQGIMSDGHI